MDRMLCCMQKNKVREDASASECKEQASLRSFLLRCDGTVSTSETVGLLTAVDCRGGLTAGDLDAFITGFILNILQSFSIESDYVAESLIQSGALVNPARFSSDYILIASERKKVVFLLHYFQNSVTNLQDMAGAASCSSSSSEKYDVFLSFGG